jgi:predicted dithiol-disulfide oxidoreductase (DUF899 family)
MPSVGEDASAVIQALEIEIAEKKQKLAELRRRQPRVPLPAYSFGLGETLDDLFEGRDDLLIVHNMGKNCTYCTLWADGFVGLHRHILNRCAFAVVSPNDPETQSAFAESRNWPFRMVSDRELRFTKDMGMYVDGEGSGRAYRASIETRTGRSCGWLGASWDQEMTSAPHGPCSNYSKAVPATGSPNSPIPTRLNQGR